MISMKEVLKDHTINEVPIDQQHNLEELLKRVNKVRADYGKPMTVSSGYRSMQEHLDIYFKKGITDKSKIPMKSHHLYGRALDIYDPKQELQKWCLANVDKLKEYQLWCEDFSATPNWVHFQIEPPLSGKRFYLP